MQIESTIATSAVSAYFNTFNYASMKATDGFDHLVQEQTPGGMNEGVIRELKKKGNYDNLKEQMDDVLSKMREDK